jgi:pimeloyl-ACP methyl ester carboxylesterase
MIEPLCHGGLYSVILVDLPGFGRSSGRDLNQASWKRHAPEIVVAILSSFRIEKVVNVLATCGMLITFFFSSV